MTSSPLIGASLETVRAHFFKRGIFTVLENEASPVFMG